jgi:multiple sugar transport system permease protein
MYGITLVMFYPVIWIMISSIKQNRDLFHSPPIFFPTMTPSWEHYQKLFATTNYLLYLRNSFIVAIGSTLLCVTLATLAAYGLTRYNFRGKHHFATFTLLIYVFPPIMLIIPLFIIFKHLHLSNTFWSLILGHTTFALPFSIWMLWAFFRALPVEVEEAAWIDGASRVRAIKEIVWKLALPGIATVSIFTFVVSWSDYLFALVFVEGESIKTLPLATAGMYVTEASEMGMVLAAGVLIVLPSLCVLFFLQRYLLKGFELTGV